MKPWFRNLVARTALPTIRRVASLLVYIPGFTYGKYLGLSHRARIALSKGKDSRAERDARQLLAIAERYEPDWNHGNAIHHGNLILGHVALRRGDVAGAREHLLKAADIEGSPQLDTFGPNMRLAQELLEVGETKAVLKYLEGCKKFWEMGSEHIDHWREQIRHDQIPNFGNNLVY
jgi:hypothetical protein